MNYKLFFVVLLKLFRIWFLLQLVRFYVAELKVEQDKESIDINDEDEDLVDGLEDEDWKPVHEITDKLKSNSVICLYAYLLILKTYFIIIKYLLGKLYLNW